MGAALGDHAHVTAGHVGNVGEAVLLENADCQMGAKARPAVHDDAPILGQAIELEAQVVHRKVHGPSKMRRFVLTESSDVENEGRLGSG